MNTFPPLQQNSTMLRTLNMKLHHQKHSNSLCLPQMNIRCLFPECTDQEIAQIISQLQNGKSNDFPIRVIKKLSSILTPVLIAKFNNLMTDGIFPSCLKTRKITPIFN